MTTGKIYKCLKCGEYLEDNISGCLKCGYPSDYIVHISRLTSEEVEREIYRETEIMMGMDHSDITMDGMYGNTEQLKDILSLTEYQADMLKGWAFGVLNSDIL